MSGMSGDGAGREPGVEARGFAACLALAEVSLGFQRRDLFGNRRDKKLVHRDTLLLGDLPGIGQQ